MYQYVSHRHTFVEDSQLSLWSVRRLRVDEDPAVLDGPVDVGNHRADVSKPVRLRPLLLRLDVFGD